MLWSVEIGVGIAVGIGIEIPADAAKDAKGTKHGWKRSNETREAGDDSNVRVRCTGEGRLVPTVR